MKEEVHIKHSKLLPEALTFDFDLLDHPDLEPDFKKQIAFDVAFTKAKTSKFKLSKLSDVSKLRWLFDADKFIDFDLTYPIIESAHETNFLKAGIDAELNGKELKVSIDDLEQNLGSNFKFENHNYEYYLHFNIASNPLKMPVLVETTDLINNIIKYNYTNEDFFFSVPFFNSLINLEKDKTISLAFVIISSAKANKTIGIKAEFDKRAIQKYYDMSYTPPPPTKLATEQPNGKGSVMGENQNPIYF